MKHLTSPLRKSNYFQSTSISCQRRTMPNHLWTSACALAALVAVQSTASFAQDPTIGNATATKHRVEGLVGSPTQTLSKGTRGIGGVLRRHKALPALVDHSRAGVRGTLGNPRRKDGCAFALRKICPM